jgi:hypothetical protein
MAMSDAHHGSPNDRAAAGHVPGQICRIVHSHPADCCTVKAPRLRERAVRSLHLSTGDEA